MKVSKGRVVAGRIVIEGESLEEGAIVTVISSENDETFGLGVDEERALLASIAEAECGDTVSGEEFPRWLSNRR